MVVVVVVVVAGGCGGGRPLETTGEHRFWPGVGNLVLCQHRQDPKSFARSGTILTFITIPENITNANHFNTTRPPQKSQNLNNGAFRPMAEPPENL